MIYPARRLYCHAWRVEVASAPDRLDRASYQLIRDGYNPRFVPAQAAFARRCGLEVIPPPHCGNVDRTGRCRGHYLPAVPFDVFFEVDTLDPETAEQYAELDLKIPRDVPQGDDPLTFWRSVWEWRCSGGPA